VRAAAALAAPVALGVSLLTGAQPARAQQAQAPPAPTFPAGAKIDAKARQTLEQMAAAYQALSSYSGTVEVESNGLPNPLNRRSTIAFKKPNKAAVVTTKGDAVTRAVTDGAHFFVASTRDKSKYLKVPLPKEAQAISLVIDQGGAAGLGLVPLVLAGYNPLAPLANTLQSLSVGQPGTLTGVPVETVVAVVNGSKGDSATITYSIGKNDHLLRRLNIKQTVEGKPVSLTETHTDVKANPDLPATALAFTPPPGAKAVDRIDAPVSAGSVPPAINAKDLSGKAVSLDQYKGKVVLLDFWAPSSGRWVAEMPNAVALYNKYKGRGFEIIGISLDPDQATFRAFVKNHKLPWRQVVGDKGPALAVAQRYGVPTVPFTVLVGRDGKIAAVADSTVRMEPAIRAALDKKK
jgi:outer membrane lipoprotein-sorting protein/peroxiredoxin